MARRLWHRIRHGKPTIKRVAPWDFFDLGLICPCGKRLW